VLRTEVGEERGGKGLEGSGQQERACGDGPVMYLFFCFFCFFTPVAVDEPIEVINCTKTKHTHIPPTSTTKTREI
jgi:hypothetical protein